MAIHGSYADGNWLGICAWNLKRPSNGCLEITMKFIHRKNCLGFLGYQVVVFIPKKLGGKEGRLVFVQA